MLNKNESLNRVIEELKGVNKNFPDIVKNL